MITGRIDQIAFGRPPQKNAKLPIAGPASTGAGGGWMKPTVLKL